MVKFEVKPLVEWWGITRSLQICGDLKICLNSCNVGTVGSYRDCQRNMIQWTTITNVSLKKPNYKPTFAVFLLHPTTAPSAKAAREKQKVSRIWGTQGSLQTFCISYSLHVLSADPEQHMSI